MNARKQIPDLDSLVCRAPWCKRPCELHQIADIETVEDGAVIAEWRCLLGHIQLQILKPGDEAVELGRELALKYGWDKEDLGARDETKTSTQPALRAISQSDREKA